MNHKYIVTLTEDERNMLRNLIEKGRTQGYWIKHAQILLKLDEIPENREWTYAKIKEAYHTSPLPPSPSTPLTLVDVQQQTGTMVFY